MALLATAGWAEIPRAMDWVATAPLAFLVLSCLTVVGGLLVIWLERRRSAQEPEGTGLSSNQFTLISLFQIMLGASMWLALLQSRSLLQIVVLWGVLLTLYAWRRKWHVLLIHSIFPATIFITAAIAILDLLGVPTEPSTEPSVEPFAFLCSVFWWSGVVSFPVYFTRFPKPQ